MSTVVPAVGDSDKILRALLEDGRARAVVVTLTSSLQEMTRRHDLVGLPAAILGRASLAGLLLATLTKDDEQVTLQIVTQGPVGGVTVDARSSGKVRGFLKRRLDTTWDGSQVGGERLSLAGLIGTNGVVSVIRDLGLAQNYSGQCSLKSGEIDEDVEVYLNTSEQIDSVLRCEVLLDAEGQVAAAAGILVQTLPQAKGIPMVEFIRDSLRGSALAEVLHDHFSRNDVQCAGIARSALGQCAEGMQILDERPVAFFCPCTRARALSTLSMLRPDDLKEMTLENQEAEVVCEFCGARYRFSKVELEPLRQAQLKRSVEN